MVAAGCMVLYGYDAAVFNTVQTNAHWLKWFNTPVRSSKSRRLTILLTRTDRLGRPSVWSTLRIPSELLWQGGSLVAQSSVTQVYFRVRVLKLTVCRQIDLAEDGAWALVVVSRLWLPSSRPLRLITTWVFSSSAAS